MEDIKRTLRLEGYSDHQVDGRELGKQLRRLIHAAALASWESASREGDVDVLRREVELGRDVNVKDRYSQTALMRAAHHGHKDAVRFLVEQGANLNTTAKFGLTALMLAVLSGKPDIAKLLIKAGADASPRGTGAPGFAGLTAADFAEARDGAELAAELRSSPGA